MLLSFGLFCHEIWKHCTVFLTYDVICASCKENYADARDIFRTIFHITFLMLTIGENHLSEHYNGDSTSKFEAEIKRFSEILDFTFEVS